MITRRRILQAIPFVGTFLFGLKNVFAKNKIDKPNDLAGAVFCPRCGKKAAFFYDRFYQKPTKTEVEYGYSSELTVIHRNVYLCESCGIVTTDHPFPEWIGIEKPIL